MSYDPVHAPRVADAIVAQIEDLILDAILTPGERLPGERELADALDVSRTSLRDALVRLEARGLLQVRPGGGTFVCDILGPTLTDPLVHLLKDHPEAIRDLLELRLALEEIAAYYAARRATEPDLEHLRQLFEDLAERTHLRDPDEEGRRIVEFHLAIAYASHNVALMHVVRGLFNLMRAGVRHSLERIYSQEDTFDIVHGYRERIYHAIAARDPEAARAAAHGLVLFVNQTLRESDQNDADDGLGPDLVTDLPLPDRDEPVKTGRQSDSIAVEIERQLATGELGPGQPLPSEVSLAETYGVTRAVVREALVRLEARGLLRLHQGGEIRVRDLPGPTLNDPLVHLLESHPSAVFDFLELRKSLDELAACLAATRATEPDRTRLQECLTVLLQAFAERDPHTNAEHDTNFHLCLAEASHNVALVYVMRGLFNLMRTNIRKNLEQLQHENGAYDTVQRQHQTIFDAVIAGDPEAAREAAHVHVTFVNQTLRQMDLHAQRAARSKRRYTDSDTEH